MCGKFAAMVAWRGVTDLSQPLPVRADDQLVLYTPMATLPVIVYDRDAKRRRVVPMRWGFPDWKNPRLPKPIHARAETIDSLEMFRDAFAHGQRGIVIFRTFNEGQEITPKKTEQWTIDPGDEVPRGIAFLWRRFHPQEFPAPFLACVMATVPASPLIAPITERMPAILEQEDWPVWLGEQGADLNAVKSVLKTKHDVRWTMRPERRKPKADDGFI